MRESEREASLESKGKAKDIKLGSRTPKKGPAKDSNSSEDYPLKKTKKRNSKLHSKIATGKVSVKGDTILKDNQSSESESELLAELD